MNWIWLDAEKYPDFQKNYTNINSVSDEEKAEYAFCAADFRKLYSFDKTVLYADIRVSGDSFFHLYVNGKIEGIGPVCSGGDFLCTEKAPKHYANNYKIVVNSNELDIGAKVKLLPQVLTDYSRGHGGFALEGTLHFKDGTTEDFSTDNTWLARVDRSYNGFCSFDSGIEQDEFSNAVETEDIWQAQDAPIPMLSINTVCEKEITVLPGKTVERKIELDKIYGVYPVISADGECTVELDSCELEGQQTMSEKAAFKKPKTYFSFRMHSAGLVNVKVHNTSAEIVNISITLLAPWYPVTETGVFRCSDVELNKVYDVCTHTLKICRQTLHLDSTKHQELLACTGDYYIESLITLYAFGDMRLSEFDVIRTADWLCANNGVMFHTTYSLIWVQMLWDVYMITGNIKLLKNCENALDVLLKRFNGSKGESGVIENVHDYMFVDWTVIDGYSMHHPPKALGQTVLNAFYYEALNKAALIYNEIGEIKKSADCALEAEDFKKSFNKEFYDAENELYFDGKNDAHGGWQWLPENSEKRYFSKYPNILACLYGLAEADKAKSIIERIIFNDSMQDIQPYFMHFMINAVRKLGLFEKYGMQLLERWKPVAAECDKGLKEGWIAPEENYSFDHSHAWGGTVAYQLPSAISGMKILEPGMKKLSFAPELYNLEWAEIEIPTKYGKIEIKLKKGEKPFISVPEGIETV